MREEDWGVGCESREGKTCLQKKDSSLRFSLPQSSCMSSLVLSWEWSWFWKERKDFTPNLLRSFFLSVCDSGRSLSLFKQSFHAKHHCSLTPAVVDAFAHITCVWIPRRLTLPSSLPSFTRNFLITTSVAHNFRTLDERRSWVTELEEPEPSSEGIQEGFFSIPFCLMQEAHANQWTDCLQMLCVYVYDYTLDDRTAWLWVKKGAENSCGGLDLTTRLSIPLPSDEKEQRKSTLRREKRQEENDIFVVIVVLSSSFRR